MLVSTRESLVSHRGGNARSVNLAVSRETFEKQVIEPKAMSVSIDHEPSRDIVRAHIRTKPDFRPLPYETPAPSGPSLPQALGVPT